MSPLHEHDEAMPSQVPGRLQPIPPTSSVMTLRDWNQTQYDDIQKELSSLVESRDDLSNRIAELSRMEKIVAAALQVSEEYMSRTECDSPQPTRSYDYDYDRVGH